MPPDRVSTTRAQRAFAPLIIRTNLRSEKLTSNELFTLPWRKPYPPHVQGIPAADAIPSFHPEPAPVSPLEKIQRPKGAARRKPATGRGFQLRESLNLGSIYDEMLVSVPACSVI